MVDVKVEEILSEKKKHILLSAMKLFATKGYVQTTMQEVAQFCKMSKGSVYQHYASKEELLFSIFKYYFKLINDQIQLVMREQSLSPRERLAKQIEVIFTLSQQYPEFLTMQMRENASFSNKDIEQFIEKASAEHLQMITDGIIDIYGESFAPYSLEMALLLSGMISTYNSIMLMEKVSLSTDMLSGYIVRMVDYAAEGLIQERPEPLLNEEMWPRMKLIASREHSKPAHPLVLVKQMRERLARLELSAHSMQDALDSISVLEKELMEVQPRRIILLGMIANLRAIEELGEELNGLTKALAQSLEHININAISGGEA
nr:TetR/AcrR family transcriptional regulator [Paenibacillus apiarius]